MTADADEVDDLLAAAQPAVDPVEHGHRRAQLAQRLFGVAFEPERLDRFVILERLGGGGMGVVYGAYDPQLDRRVALKLVRIDRGDDSASQSALVREAQALARLSHPNIVPIHDVGVIEQRVYLVMEFIAGADLRTWNKAASRPWRDVVGVYRQAAHGLHAAHTAGLVHRDFKPENALIGDDDRVRVIDFGLVSQPSEDAAPRVAGTPSYMAPEQLAGADVGPAADQFALCVSMWEALFGALPFANDAQTIAESAGELAAVPRGASAPGWLVAALRQGLSSNPAARHASLGELAAVLARDPARTRRRVGWAAGFVVAVGAAAAVAVLGRGAEPASCNGGADAISSAWNVDSRRAVAAGIGAGGTDYAREVVDRVLPVLDAYAATWQRSFDGVCRAHRRKELTAAQFERAQVCLHERRAALESGASVLQELDAVAVSRAVEVAGQLPVVEACVDVRRLAAAVPPPADPRTQAAVGRVRETLARAAALEAAGRYDDALGEVHDALANAERAGYAPAVAEALLAKGRVLMQSNLSDALGPLTRATRVGLESGADRVAIEALARRIFVQATVAGADGDLMELVPIAEALVGRTSDAGATHALLLNNVGVVFMARGEPATARLWFQRALGARPADDAGTELAVIARNLAMVTDDAQEHRRLLSDHLAELERKLGPNHPQTLQALLATGLYELDDARARAILEPASERFARMHPHLSDVFVYGLYELAFLALESGRADDAAPLFERASSLWQGRDDGRAAVALGFQRLCGDELDAAVAQFRAALVVLNAQPSEGWWIDQQKAEARLGLGLALGRQGKARAAQTELATAAAAFAPLVDITREAGVRRRLNTARAAR